ncbi:MAG: EamA family transporter [Anaerotignum sp.]|nr:EamA family transporter [Anaerotignum sp.]
MNRNYLKYIAALLLFGSNGIVAGQIGLSSYEIVFLRACIGGLFLLSIFLLRKQPWACLQNRRHFAFLAVSGISMGISWIFLYEAYRQIGVGVASLVYYCAPMIVMGLSPVFFNEKLTLQKGIGIGIVFLGILLINGQTLGDGNRNWGLFCGAMGAFAYVAMLIYNKKAKSIKGMENAVLQLVFAGVAVAVFLLCRQGAVIKIAKTDWLPILTLGIVNTGLGCYLYFSAVQQLSMQTAAVCSYLEPFSAVVFSAAFLGEAMRAIQILGAVLILGGAVYAEIADKSFIYGARPVFLQTIKK